MKESSVPQDPCAMTLLSVNLVVGLKWRSRLPTSAFLPVISCSSAFAL